MLTGSRGECSIYQRAELSFATFLKVAPYSFTIARALMTKAQVIGALKGKHQCFSIFMTST